MTIKKFDGNLWKWLLDNVVSKLLPAATVSDAGKVPTVQSDGSYALGGAYLPLSGGEMESSARISMRDTGSGAVATMTGGDFSVSRGGKSVRMSMSGITSGILFTEEDLDDYDYVQKKYVDDAIEAAIEQLKESNPTLT